MPIANRHSVEFAPIHNSKKLIEAGGLGIQDILSGVSLATNGYQALVLPLELRTGALELDLLG